MLCKRSFQKNAIFKKVDLLLIKIEFLKKCQTTNKIKLFLIDLIILIYLFTFNIYINTYKCINLLIVEKI